MDELEVESQEVTPPPRTSRPLIDDVFGPLGRDFVEPFRYPDKSPTTPFAKTYQMYLLIGENGRLRRSVLL